MPTKPATTLSSSFILLSHTRDVIYVALSGNLVQCLFGGQRRLRLDRNCLPVWGAGVSKNFASVLKARARLAPALCFAFLIAGSASGAFAQSSTTTTVLSSSNPSQLGQSVTFTATIRGSGGEAPAGTVQFKDGANALGSPVTVNTLGVGHPIAAGQSHTCVLAQETADVLCWGDSNQGQLGFGGTVGAGDFFPNRIYAGVSGVVAIAAGAVHTCALTAEGAVKCWGHNLYGQLGGTTNGGLPTKSAIDSGLSDIVAIAAGQFHSCALTAAGGVKCWGDNRFGELGSSANIGVDTANPTPIDTGLSGVVAIAASGRNTCALTADGAVKCWGLNYYGELGSTANNGIFIANPTPIDVGLSGVVAIAAGGGHTCALTADGAVKCWGFNRYGQLGSSTNNGTENANPTPIDVGLSGVAAIAAGGTHTCALTADGAVKCWGINHYGQLGSTTNNGTNGANPTPIDVGLSGVAAIAAGGAHTCALTADGAAKCWGLNQYAQLGNGTSTTNGTTDPNPTPLNVTDFGDGTAQLHGSATYTTLALTAGSHSITAAYSGDGNHDGSTSSALTQSVAKAGQTVSFDSTAPATPRVGTTYAPAATATSSLAVSLGVSGACSYDAGQVTFTAAGSCTVTADQGGDASYNPAPQVTQDISVAKGITTATVQSSTSQTTPGQQVTFTATAALTGSSIQPTGNVTFKDGANTIGTGPLVSGTVTMSSSALAIGSHNITVVYGGGADFEAAISPAIVHNVNAKIGTQAGVNSETDGAQEQPAIARLTTGYVVAWASAAQDGSGDGIFMQRFNANGAKAGAETRVNTTTAGDQSKPSIAGLADGSFVVVWQSTTGDGNGMGVYAQMFRSNGVKSRAEFKVNTTVRSHQSLPSVAALADGGFVVAWVSNLQDGSGLGIYAQRYNGTGAPVAAEFKVNKTTAGNQTAPSVAGLDNGSFVIAWQSPDDSGQGIFMQRYNAAGKAQGAETQVNTTELNDQSLPRVAGLANGSFVVVWQSNLQDGSKLGIYMQRFGANGAKLGGELRVNTATANDQTTPAISSFSDNGFVVVWTSRNQDGSGLGVYAQVFDNAGRKVNAELLINTTTTGNQSQPAVAAFADGKLAAAWTSDSDGDAQGIFAQRFQVPIGD
jgi:alpha-tubulin suppressor-like RCC1 family protein